MTDRTDDPGNSEQFADRDPDDPGEDTECGAVYVTSTLGGMDICTRPAGHAGGHDWRGDR